MIKVVAEFQTYWQISTGRGAGHFMDAVIDQDVNGLPYVSGKTLKGLFRSATEKIEAWQPESQPVTDLLFGSVTQQARRHETQAGCLSFSNLQLSGIEIEQLNQHPHLKRMLTQSVSNTQIDVLSGVAKDKSLRTQQVAVPLTLEGEITLSEQASLSMAEAFKTLERAAVFVTHVGAKKSRGYGQVKITLTQEKSS